MGLENKGQCLLYNCYARLYLVPMKQMIRCLIQESAAMIRIFLVLGVIIILQKVALIN